MLSPYTGAARETFERIHTGRSYYTNKIYKSPERLLYYINKSGFLHVYKAERRSTPDGNIKIYCLVDYRLNKDNSITESGATWYSSPEALKEAARELETAAATA